MRVHVFQPANQGQYPGLLLFSEIYQATDPIRRLATIIAGHGFVVGVPEVYHEFESPGTVLAYDKEGTERGNYLKTSKSLESFDADARAGLRYLSGHPAANGKIATMGLCLGGHLALRAAFNPEVSVAICCYPTDVHSGSLGAGKCDDTLARMHELRAKPVRLGAPGSPYSFRRSSDPTFSPRRIRSQLRMARSKCRPCLHAGRGAALRPAVDETGARSNDRYIGTPSLNKPWQCDERKAVQSAYWFEKDCLPAAALHRY